MQLSLKPYVTNGIVIAGAAALVAAPITISPPDISQPLAIAERTIAVEQKAFVNDLLDAFALVADATGETISNAIYFVGVEPNFEARWAQALIQNPGLVASIASGVVTLELLDLLGIPSPLIGALTSLLPAQLGQPIADAYDALFEFIDPGRLGGLLPDPTDGINAINAALLPPLVDSFTNGIVTAFDSVGVSIWGGLGFVGQAPNALLSVAQSAIADPGDIPGLASFLAYSLINPFSNPVPIDSVYSLAIEPLIDGVINTAVPPIGGLVAAVKNGLDGALTAVLNALPAPVAPSPFVSPLRAPANDVSSAEVVPADNARVVNVAVADTSVADPEKDYVKDPGDTGGDVKAASAQQDPPEADDPGTTTNKARANGHVRLNVKKVNPLVGKLDDTKTVSADPSNQADSDTPEIVSPVNAGAGSPDTEGAPDNSVDGEHTTENADAGQDAK
ncbi:hypothetical protein A5724_02995 [Mycobacterium sp. ACS1612]|uniref:hypothetical protein n=1 Tax=Mycobacterium sp. ACS1612 TaxID=1834117 RepID=UPI0007FF981F|nr:hypothetical protein [Mycobacterium sp. ACS1612]OBF27038.1 hypothetical protein A5724_02995 [Mycobacterium sp. ACS1612]